MAEEALRANQELLEGIINAIPVRVFWKDKNLVYLGCNAIFAKDAGFDDPKDLIGKDDYQVAWRAQAELYRGADRQVIANGRPPQLMEEPQTTPEGEQLVLLTSKIPLRAANGDISGVLGTYVDITNMKRAEQKLWESQERLRVTLRSVADAVVTTDVHGKVTLLSNLAEALTGWREAEALGKNIEDIIQIQDGSTGRVWANPVRAALENDQAGDLAEYVDLRVGGASRCAIAGSCAPIRNEAGVIVGAILVFRDITERKLAEDAIKAERTNLNAIFNASPIGMMVLDDTTAIVRTNAAARKMISGEVADLINPRPGNALVCAHTSADPRGCGYAPPCKICPMRQGVESIIAGGVSISGAEVPATLVRHGVPQTVWLKVGAEPLQIDGRRHVVVALDDITQRKLLEDELRLAARQDKLTGLPNRLLLLDRMQQAIERRRRSAEARYAVLFFDFDRFKTVNDTLGHQTGDELLREIACRLQSVVRGVDSVSRLAPGNTTARLGGDEFVILLDCLRDETAAKLVSERLLDVLSTPYQLGGHEVVSTASIGIVMSDYAYERAEDVLRDADSAMYEAKLAGRGRAVVFNGAMRERVQRKVELESGLRKALDEGQFVLHYQPIISLETHQLQSVEALVVVSQ